MRDKLIDGVMSRRFGAGPLPPTDGSRGPKARVHVG